MRRLILVKHSSPKVRADLPRRQWHLSEEGVVRCVLLATHLARYRPTRIFSSREPKAYETAAALTGILGQIPMTMVEGLREHDDGDSPLVSEDAFRSVVKSFFAHPGQIRFGRETADEAFARFSSAVISLPSADEDRSVVVVAHGRVISLFVARHNDSDPYELWRRLGHPSLVVLKLPGYRVEKIVDRVQ